jgi:hypothetical protein
MVKLAVEGGGFRDSRILRHVAIISVVLYLNIGSLSHSLPAPTTNASKLSSKLQNHESATQKSPDIRLCNASKRYRNRRLHARSRNPRHLHRAHLLLYRPRKSASREMESAPKSCRKHLSSLSTFASPNIPLEKIIGDKPQRSVRGASATNHRPVDHVEAAAQKSRS